MKPPKIKGKFYGIYHMFKLWLSMVYLDKPWQTMVYSDKPWPGNCTTKLPTVFLNKMTCTNYLWVSIICDFYQLFVGFNYLWFGQSGLY